MLRKIATLNVLFLTLSIVSVISSDAMGQSWPGGEQSQEVSDVDGIPVLIKHLPSWNELEGNARFIKSQEVLRARSGDRPIFHLIDFSGGTEAVDAQYPEGTLLIVEYMTPQAATFANDRFRRHVDENPEQPPVVYRRVGNYSVFVFDAQDQIAASALIDQVKYGKSVQWLGEDPFLQQRLERYVAVMSRDVALSTLLWVFFTGSTAILIGLVTGFLFFRSRERSRLTRTAYSDAGGLTRLNLDGLSEPGSLES